jgi:hypothetical protein
MTTLFERAYDFGNMSSWAVQDIVGNEYDFAQQFNDRRAFVTHFGWSLPCKEAVEAIKTHTRQPLFDVLAGTGYWTKILRQAGVNVIASDIHKLTNKNDYHKRDNCEVSLKTDKPKIIRRNALKVAYHIATGRLQGDLFLSWPPYQGSFAFDVLSLVPIGTRVVYIGEGEGGCTADAAFHKCLELNYAEICCVQLPQFVGIHDYLAIYEKDNNYAINPKFRGVCYYREPDEDEEEELKEVA